MCLSITKLDIYITKIECFITKMEFPITNIERKYNFTGIDSYSILVIINKVRTKPLF